MTGCDAKSIFQRKMGKILKKAFFNGKRSKTQFYR